VIYVDFEEAVKRGLFLVALEEKDPTSSFKAAERRFVPWEN
jgi:hypothetical protein